MVKRPDVMDDAYIEKHFGELLLEGLQEALAYERGDHTAAARVVVRTARDTTISPPPSFEPIDIVRIRTRLGMSQAVFARALNVSVATVAAWEQGGRRPVGSAVRLLEVADTAPEWFRGRVREPVTVQPG